MSTPLDGRIRSIAREEAQQAVGSVDVLDVTALDTQGLQQQITDLHEHLHMAVTSVKRLEERVATLESAAQTEEPTTGVRRTRRKTTDE